jgi:hypothetical protein
MAMSLLKVSDIEKLVKGLSNQIKIRALIQELKEKKVF